jgi:hypothetical protein
LPDAKTPYERLAGIHTQDQQIAVLIDVQSTLSEMSKEKPFACPAVLSGESGILESYQVTAYPTFIPIGRDGKIVANQVGFGDQGQLRQMMDEAGLAPQ